MALTYRLRSGAYRTLDGRYRVQRTEQGDGWHLFDDDDADPYMGTFDTKRAALDWLTHHSR